MKLVKSLLFWTLLIEAIIVVVLGCLGFKITYDPSIITDWNAVSAVASWVSAFATIGIPIIAVIFQHKLDQNKNEIGESNKATLEELQKFKEEYTQIIDALLGNSKSETTAPPPCINIDDQRLLKYIQASIRVTADDVAMYFGTTRNHAIQKLNALVAQKKIMKTYVQEVICYSLHK